MATKKKAVETAAEPKFAKSVLVNAKRFRDACDLVSALLQDGAEYTIAEVEEMIAKYKKGKVK